MLIRAFRRYYFPRGLRGAKGALPSPFAESAVVADSLPASDHSVRSRAPPADSASRLGARLNARKIVTATSTLSLYANKLETVKIHRFVKFCVYPSAYSPTPLVLY